MGMDEVLNSLEEVRNTLTHSKDAIEVEGINRLSKGWKEDYVTGIAVGKYEAFNIAENLINNLLEEMQQEYDKNYNFYFTFGTDKNFPYRNSYLIVKAHDLWEACEIFKEKYPDKINGTLCCSDYYTEPQWYKSGCDKLYDKPVEIL